jgi:hypothetical protein
MDRSDDTLFAELREVRPKPRPEFTADLDERAAAGFPRRADPTRTVTPFTLFADHWRTMSPRRRLMPVLGFALAAVVVATVVIASIGGDRGGSELVVTSATSSEASSGEAGGGRNGHLRTLPAESSGGEEEAAEAAGAEIESESSAAGGAGVSGGEAIEARPEEEAEGTKHAGEEHEQIYAPATPVIENGPKKSPGVTAGHRDVERSAYITLGTKPGEVGGAAARVYRAVHAAHGIVLHSSVDSGAKGATGAIFELLIPTGRVDDALASISQIAEVRARHDASNDITAPTVGAAEELADSNASIEGLLKELGNAETESEREAVEVRLREERRRHAAIRSSLDHLRERGAMSEVTVRIVTSHGAGATPAGDGSDGNWGVGDALHDAGHILTIAAGVLLIALAVLAPIALIALLVWLTNRFRVRRLRERTLG